MASTIAKLPALVCSFHCFVNAMFHSRTWLDWVEGVAIMVAILIVVIVGSLNDWQKERQFRKLNDKKEDRGVKVIRDGNEQIINIKVRFRRFLLSMTCRR